MKKSFVGKIIWTKMSSKALDFFEMGLVYELEKQLKICFLDSWKQNLNKS